VNPRTVVLVVAGVAGALIAARVIRGASSIGEAVQGAAGAAVQGIGRAANAVNPFNNNNVINRAANSIWETITGRPGQTIGLSVQEWFTPRAVSRAPAMYSADADDAALGAAIRAAGPPRGALRTPPPGWTVQDQEDADEGAAMRGADMTRAGYSDVYPRLR
jgi:hypothetical protein